LVISSDDEGMEGSEEDSESEGNSREKKTSNPFEFVNCINDIKTE
jgi:hypothetical protein